MVNIEFVFAKQLKNMKQYVIESWTKDWILYSLILMNINYIQNLQAAFAEPDAVADLCPGRESWRWGA